MLDVCNSLTRLWDASPDRPVIHNLPATVGVSTPNVYADQIEYMHRHLEDRDAVILSVHPHNDRGTGVACAELAVPAGAQRVEGCLFGNGERTGNVDLVSLAPNLHAQGVDPMIDLSDIDWFVERWSTATEFPSTSCTSTAATSCTRRSPAPIRMRSRRGSRSQSGKGGIAHLLQSEYGITLPRRLQIDFAAKVQEEADSSGLEITAEQLWTLFCAEYGYRGGLGRWSVEHGPDGDRLFVVFDVAGVEVSGEAVATGLVEEMTRVLTSKGVDLDVLSLTQHSHRSGSDSAAITLAECRVRSAPVSTY